MTEKTIPEETLQTIKGAAREALDVLPPVGADADPQKLVAAVDDFVYRWQKDRRPPLGDNDVDPDDVPTMLASLWGEQIVADFGWQWTQIWFDSEAWTYAIVSPDRSLVIYPFTFVDDCLRGDVDVTIELAFNMLDGGTIPQRPPNTYEDVMAGVRHIAPRD
jgi:hypothetical protein